MSSSSSSSKIAVWLALAVAVLILLKSCSKSSYHFIAIINNRHDEDGFRFASYYQDNMVLQAEPHNAVIWGYGSLGSTVEVLVDSHSYVAKVDRMIDGQGVWRVVLNPYTAGTQVAVTATQETKNIIQTTISIKNVLFGDVWVCSGQSNMAFPISHMFNSTDELNLVSKYPDLRIFTAAQVTSNKPLYDFNGISRPWEVPTKDNVPTFSAVCWVFARHLHDKFKTPIGLVQSNWGGTPVECWSSPGALSACGLGKGESSVGFGTVRKLFYSENDAPTENSVLWNAMIHPILNMTIKGAIWYQGEANARRNRDLYNCTFPNMIKDWRKSWLEGTGGHTDDLFPFGFVQLASVTSTPENGMFPMVRWHQTADFGYVPNSAMPKTFMAAALDLADPQSPYGSVHIRDKEDVGKRLSSAALHHVFKVGPDEEGPHPVAAVQDLGYVVLKYSSDNLVIDGGAENNFEVCCRDSNCDVSDLSEHGMDEWLASGINDYGTDTIQISGQNCDDKLGVKRIRYAWKSTPCEFKKCQLYSKQGFPAPPFVIDVTHYEKLLV